MKRRDITKKAREKHIHYNFITPKQVIESKLQKAEIRDRGVEIKKELEKMSEEQRKVFLEKHGINPAFFEGIERLGIEDIEELRIGDKQQKKKLIFAGGGGGASVPSVGSEGLEAIIKIALIGIAVLAVFYFLFSLF